MTDLSDRVAVVTGASSGLGRHFCGVLADAGATVVATARRADRLHRLTEEDPRIIAVPGDVTVEADAARVVDAARELGGPDILVNAAGFGDDTPALATTTEMFRRTLDVNLTGAFDMATRCARLMLERPTGGSIVNITSIFGLAASWPLTQSAYCAAKAGLVNLTRQLGAELADRGVRVNAIAPGWFPSELTEEMFTDERSVGWVHRNTPMRRVGRLEELDGALLLLASDAGSFITGQTLAVDGGWSLR